MKTILPAIDQGRLNNCKAQSIGYGFKAQFGIDFDVNWLMVIGTRQGVGINNMLDALLTVGALPIGSYSIEPTDTTLAILWAREREDYFRSIAVKYKPKEYKRITSAPELLAALKEGWYAVITVIVPKNQSHYPVDADGIFRPHLAEGPKDAHAMSAWYVNSDGTIRVLNSWGKGWGNNGEANMTPEDALRVDHCFAYRFDAPPAPIPEEPTEKEDKEVRYTAFIKTVTAGAAVKVRETSAAGSTQIGTIKDGSAVLILSEEGTRREVCFSGKPQEYFVGWIPASYLLDKPPEEPFAPVTKGIFAFTEDQKDLRLTEHFIVGDFWAFPGHKKIKLDTTLAHIWEKFYAHFGARPLLRNKNLGTDKPYLPQPSAGYRDALNWSGRKTSQHCYGRGLDFYIPGVPAYKLAQFAETLPEIGGIGLYLVKSGELGKVKHIHIDTRSGNRARWGWDGKTGETKTPGFGGIPCAFRRGNRSAAIEEVQITLNALGYSCGTPDGDWGDKTDKAFRAWQQACGLKVDGVYGEESNKLMGLFDWKR